MHIREKWYWREVFRYVLLTVHEVIMTQFCLCKCLLGLAISPYSFSLPVYYQGAHSTKFPHYLLLGLENLFSILGLYYNGDNKGMYQQFLPMERSLKKSCRDNIKGTTLISGEHVKPCNETYWKCLITAREMKLQDDSLIKQWLRIFCLLSNTVCSAFSTQSPRQPHREQCHRALMKFPAQMSLGKSKAVEEVLEQHSFAYLVV